MSTILSQSQARDVLNVSGSTGYTVGGLDGSMDHLKKFEAESRRRIPVSQLDASLTDPEITEWKLGCWLTSVNHV